MNRAQKFSWRRGIAVSASAAFATAGLFAALSAIGPKHDTSVRVSGALVARAAPLIVGVGTHFGIGGEYGYVPAASAKAIAQLGVTSFRDDLPWGLFKSKGLRSPGQVPVPLAAMIAATPARPLLIIGDMHPEVDGGAAPSSAAGINAFAAFAHEAAQRTPSPQPIYEIWNEWNLTAEPGRPPLRGAGDAPDRRAASYYARLAAPAVDAVRAANRGALILVGAAAIDRGWPWVQSIVREGATKHADGLSVHIYNHCERPADRTGDQAIAQVENLRAALGANTVPIYVTELGWPTTSGGSCDISPDSAADNIAQFLLWAAATPWMKGVWIYQLKDQGQRSAEIEDRFGLYDYNYREKPAACAVREVTALIRASTAWRIEGADAQVMMIQAAGASGRRLIVWNKKPDTPLTLSLGQDHRASFRRICDASSRTGGDVPLGARPVILDTTNWASSRFVTVHSTKD